MLVMVNHTQRFKILLFQNFKMFLKNVSKNLCKSIQGIHKQSKSMSRKTAATAQSLKINQKINSKDKLLFNRLVTINAPAAKTPFLWKGFTSLAAMYYYKKTESPTRPYHNSSFNVLVNCHFVLSTPKQF